MAFAELTVPIVGFLDGYVGIRKNSIGMISESTGIAMTSYESLASVTILWDSHRNIAGI